MTRNLLLLAALIASATSAAVLYKEVGGIHPYGKSHIMELKIGKLAKEQGGVIQDTTTGFPWYGQQTKEPLFGVIYQPDSQVVDSDVGYLDNSNQMFPGGVLNRISQPEDTQTVAVIGDINSNPTMRLVKQLLGHKDGIRGITLQRQPGHQLVQHDDNQEMFMRMQEKVHGAGQQLTNYYIDASGNLQQLIKGQEQPMQGNFQIMGQQMGEQLKQVTIEKMHPMIHIATTSVPYQTGLNQEIGYIQPLMKDQEEVMRRMGMQGNMREMGQQMGEQLKWVTNEKGHSTIHIAAPFIPYQTGQHQLELNQKRGFQMSHNSVGQGEGILVQEKYYPTQQVFPQQLSQRGIDSEGIEALQLQRGLSLGTVGNYHVNKEGYIFPATAGQETGFTMGQFDVNEEGMPMQKVFSTTQMIVPVDNNFGQSTNDLNRILLQGKVNPNKFLSGKLFGSQIMQGSPLKYKVSFNGQGGVDAGILTKVYPSDILTDVQL